MAKDYYIKCNKCGHKAKTYDKFHEEIKEMKWFIGGDGWCWDWEHDCDSRYSQ